MIRISGQPICSTGYEALDISWEKCMAKCRADVNCSAVYKKSDVKCQYYQFGSLSSFDQGDFAGREIALKIQLSGDQCPTSNPLVPGPINFTQVINGQHYTTTVSKSYFFEYMYNLNYSIAVPVQTCPNNTKQFQRFKGETYVVCIGLFFFEAPRCNNVTQAYAVCRAQKGTLTGPANAEEYKYIQNISNSSKYTSNPDSYKYLTYWIDGESTMREKDYVFFDYSHDGFTNYKWEVGAPRYKTMNYCLHNPAPYGLYIVDSPCNSTALHPFEVCWRGALCQVKQITVLNYL